MASIDPTERITTADTQVTNIAGTSIRIPHRIKHIIWEDCQRSLVLGAEVDAWVRNMSLYDNPFGRRNGGKVISRSKQEMQADEDRWVRNMSLYGNPFGRRNEGLY